MAGKLSCVTGPGVVDASSKSSFEGMVSELSCGGRELTLQDVAEAETRLWRRRNIGDGVRPTSRWRG